MFYPGATLHSNVVTLTICFDYVQTCVTNHQCAGKSAYVLAWNKTFVIRIILMWIEIDKQSSYEPNCKDLGKEGKRSLLALFCAAEI